MKRIISLCLASLLLLLGGCATVVSSNVTAFNEWPADLPNKSFAFEHTEAQSNDLEYRNYEGLVRTELQRLGFVQQDGGAAQLKVALKYDISARDVHVVEPVVADPMWYGPYGWGRPGFYGPGFYGPRFNDPFYNPLWYGPQVIGQREYDFQLFLRRLNVTITRAAGGQKLYDVSVSSEGKVGSLPAIMPYLVRSAFTDFPGKSGVPHVVKLKVEEQQ